jgi:hypothetical protein
MMISPTLTALLKRSSFLSRIAYEPPHIAAPILTRWGAEYTPFECIETDTQGFALVEDGELWFTFRGTEFEAGPNTGKWRDVKTDLNAWPDDGVHRGVKKAVDSVWADIDRILGVYGQVKEIRFDGHSLGGGCAEEASDRAVYNGHKDVTCITFGAPRIFTPWHRSMDAGSLYRFRKVSVGVAHNNDAVVRMPPAPLYLHDHDTHVFFNRFGLPILNPSWRSITADRVAGRFGALWDRLRPGGLKWNAPTNGIVDHGMDVYAKLCEGL